MDTLRDDTIGQLVLCLLVYWLAGELHGYWFANLTFAIVLWDQWERQRWRKRMMKEHDVDDWTQ